MNCGMFRGDVYNFYLFSLYFSRARPTGSKRLAFCQWVPRLAQIVLLLVPLRSTYLEVQLFPIHRVQLDFSVRFSSTKKSFTSIHPA
jgi:hypothetical protein